MNILILGVGNGGTTVAADLTKKGHCVTLLKTSKSLHNENYNYIKEHNNEIIFEGTDYTYTAKINMVTDDFDKAFSIAYDLIIIYIQTKYHEPLIKKILPYLSDGQVVLIEPGYLSTAYFLKYCEGKELVICEAESSPIDCRILSPGVVKELFRNVRNPVGVYPRDKKEDAMKILNELQYNFVPLDSVVEAALHNPNLIVHTVGAIMSIPRIEYSGGNYYMYREVFTPSVWNLVEKLDAEKMEVLAALELEKVQYVDACKFRNSEDLSIDSKEVFFDYAKNHSPAGPEVSNSRYVTEDVPEGLVLLESLGKVFDVKTPICTGLIDVASACLNADFRAMGRTVERLGKENLFKIKNG